MGPPASSPTAPVVPAARSLGRVINVILVDDHALIRRGLRRAIDRAEGMTVVGEAGSVRQALAVASEVSGDVAVVDVRLPDGDGMGLCRRLRDEQPSLAVVVLTMYGDADRESSARAAGAAAFVSKDAPASSIVAAIRHARTQPDGFYVAGHS